MLPELCTVFVVIAAIVIAVVAAAVAVVFYTLQEQQWILTNVAVSKVSDIENEWGSMRKLDF